MLLTWNNFICKNYCLKFVVFFCGIYFWYRKGICHKQIAFFLQMLSSKTSRQKRPILKTDTYLFFDNFYSHVFMKGKFVLKITGSHFYTSSKIHKEFLRFFYYFVEVDWFTLNNFLHTGCPALKCAIWKSWKT